MRNTLLLCLLAAAAAPALPAQGPVPARITLAEAVALAADTAPAVRLAELEVRRAGARATQARSDLLPTLTANAGVLNRSYNWAGLGVGKAGLPLPDLVGPFGMGDARLQVSQALFDAAGLQ
ncbi:MAG TPA: TolC family protein, partial [Longimicrobiaceae bacterium]|nr:TolC family protein [Longimicrobiaceae bacterium]